MGNERLRRKGGIYPPVDLCHPGIAIDEENLQYIMEEIILSLTLLLDLHLVKSLTKDINVHKSSATPALLTRLLKDAFECIHDELCYSC